MSNCDPQPLVEASSWGEGPRYRTFYVFARFARLYVCVCVRVLLVIHRERTHSSINPKVSVITGTNERSVKGNCNRLTNTLIKNRKCA